MQALLFIANCLKLIMAGGLVFFAVVGGAFLAKGPDAFCESQGYVLQSLGE